MRGVGVVNLEPGQQGALCEEVGVVAEETVVVAKQLVAELKAAVGYHHVLVLAQNLKEIYSLCVVPYSLE